MHSFMKITNTFTHNVLLSIKLSNSKVAALMKFELHTIATTNDELAVKLFDIINKKSLKMLQNIVQ